MTSPQGHHRSELICHLYETSAGLIIRGIRGIRVSKKNTPTRDLAGVVYCYFSLASSLETECGAGMASKTYTYSTSLSIACPIYGLSPLRVTTSSLFRLKFSSNIWHAIRKFGYVS